MIVVTHGTIYLTVDAFFDRYRMTPMGRAFRYATGDLAFAAEHDEEARTLIEATAKFEKSGKVSLCNVHRPDLHAPGNATALEYLATKRTDLGA